MAVTEKKPLSPEEQRVINRRRRNIALISALLIFVVLVYATTMVKIKLGYGP